MPYLEPGDPMPRKTPAELEAEETTFHKFEDVNQGSAWAGWLALAVGIFMAAGGAIAWCNK